MVLLALVLFLPGCRPAAAALPVPAESPPIPEVAPLDYTGRGSAALSIGPWQGTAVLHITAGEGDKPFVLVARDGLNRPTLLDQPAPLDEYRAWAFTGTDPVALDVQGDAEWEITLLPPTAKHFPVLKIPGTYRGQGSAVILLEGEHSIAIFSAPDLTAVSAWAYPPEGEGERLSFRTGTDYPGRAALPKNASWLLVTGPGSWSVEVQPPCCEAPGPVSSEQ